MVVFEDIQAFCEGLKNLSNDSKLAYDCLRQLKCDHVNTSLIHKGEEYLKNEKSRLERMKRAYGDFSSHFNQICEKYLTQVNVIEEEKLCEVEELKVGFEKIKEEIKEKNEELKKTSLCTPKEPSFIYKEGMKSKVDVDLVLKYPGSYMYKEYTSDHRTADGDVYIDCDGENDELIVKYMKNDKSLEEDIRKMSNKKRTKLIDDLSLLELPIKKVINQRGSNGDKQDNIMIEAWKNRRLVMVNGKNENDFHKLLDKYKLLDGLFNNECLKNIQYDKQKNTFSMNINLKYKSLIEDYLRNGKKLSNKVLKKYNNNNISKELINELMMIGIQLNENEKDDIISYFDIRLLKDSTILLDTLYDKYLREWLGKNCKCKLLYRTSEHGYTASSFHEYCDDKGPTLIIVKSNEGWIFGGYTTQSWSGCGI